MKEVRLIPKLQLKVPIEAEAITPDRFAGKSASDIASLTVWEGNRKRTLGDFFEVIGDAPSDPSELRIIIDGNVPRTKYIGAEMTAGEIIIKGSVDMHVGNEMAGGRIIVEGNADSFAGLIMQGGELIIKGNAGNYLGATYRGEWRGMRGGKIIVEGNAGSEIGSWMEGGMIIIKGSVGPFAGVHMKGGVIIVEGDACLRLGAQMTGGTIVVMGKLERILPGFSFEGTVPDVKIEELTLKGPFLKFVGDLAEDGKGNIFLLEEKNQHLAL